MLRAPLLALHRRARQTMRPAAVAGRPRLAPGCCRGRRARRLCTSGSTACCPGKRTAPCSRLQPAHVMSRRCGPDAPTAAGSASRCTGRASAYAAGLTRAAAAAALRALRRSSAALQLGGRRAAGERRQHRRQRPVQPDAPGLAAAADAVVCLQARRAVGAPAADSSSSSTRACSSSSSASNSRPCPCWQP